MSKRQRLKTTSQLDLIAYEINKRIYYCLEHPTMRGYWGSTCGQIISRVHNFMGGAEQIRGSSVPKVLVPVVMGSGYVKHILLSPEGQRISYYAHRFLAECFLEEPSPEMIQLNHINYNKIDNHIRNLEYVTPSENQRHSWMRQVIDEERNAYRRSRLKLIKKA